MLYKNYKTFYDYQMVATLSDPRPNLLIFDSGVGGLSVYNEIRYLLPNLRYIYAFDNVAFPYGEKDEVFIVKRVIKIVSAVQKRYPLALAIIACNTASIVSLPVLREKFHFPIVGVVPAIKPAVKLTANGIIGLLATSGTTEHSYTRELICRFASEYQILMLGSAELVKIAEAKLHGNIVSLEEIQCILRPWLRMPEPPDTIILGCTHFPLLREELLQTLPKKTKLVDSSTAIARRTVWILKHKELDAKSLAFGYNIAFCMTITEETEQFLPVLQSFGFKTLETLVCN